MAELHTEVARREAKAAIAYSAAFDGKGIDWQNEQPWPHRMELAQALDWITTLGAMVLNLADRVSTSETQAAQPVGREALTEAQIDRLYSNIPPSAQQDARSKAAFARITRLIERVHKIGITGEGV